jgi:hypothetical protein
MYCFNAADVHEVENRRMHEKIAMKTMATTTLRTTHSILEGLYNPSRGMLYTHPCQNNIPADAWGIIVGMLFVSGSGRIG